MHKRLILAGLTATGGLLTTAFLQVAVAAAAPGDDAFNIGGFTFDPFTSTGAEGFDPVAQLTSSPPLLELGGGSALGLPLAPQGFEVYDPTTHADLGSVQTNETITSLFGLTNGEFTITGSTPIGDATLPGDGTVYDVFNFGHGYANVYTATPDVTTDGVTTPGTVTDTFITPTGKDIDLSSLFTFNAANPMNPGDAFTGLELGNVAGAQDAFSIGGFNLDPLLTDQLSGLPTGGEGFETITPLATAAPLLELGGASLGDPATNGALSLQDFDVLNSSGTSIGTIHTGVDVTNLLGFTNTQLVVSQGSDVGQGLPTQGTVLDAFNLGHGYENVYTATPDVTTDGVTTPGTVTDTLVTPYGNINLDGLVSTFNVANPLDPGAALTGLQAGDASIGANAFSVGGFTFDPLETQPFSHDVIGEGFNPVNQLVGVPPLLNLGGATPVIPGLGSLSLSQQDFNVYDGTGSGATEVGSITTNDQVTNLLGFTNTEFTVISQQAAETIPSATPTDLAALADAPAGTLPAVGTVYDVLNLGLLENVYIATPGLDGAAATITDTLVTPFGNLDLSDLFGGIDATALLNPGDAFEALTSGITEAFSGAAGSVDPLAWLGL